MLHVPEKKFKAGTKFSSHKGLWVIIVRALYGLNSSGALFRKHISSTLREIVFKPTFYKRNMWMRKNFLLIPQELDDSAVSLMGTQNTALQTEFNTMTRPTMSKSVPGLMIC